jgi:peptidoglycan/xylan/chitin deacetylase (PgdA/CDA1 family)
VGFCSFFITWHVAAGKQDVIPSQSTLPDIAESINPPPFQNTNNDLYDSLMKHDKGKRIAYLTFDDGPSNETTPGLLDTLKKENVHATFFVVGKNVKTYPDLVKREYQEGHTIGNHSYSHDYKYVYSDYEGFIYEVLSDGNEIKKVLGNDYNIKLFRFPGGSYDKPTQKFISPLKTLGYKYIDWNTSAGDAAPSGVTSASIMGNVKKGVSSFNNVIILMHDIKPTTVKTVPQIIEYLRGMGFEFQPINPPVDTPTPAPTDAQNNDNSN